MDIKPLQILIDDGKIEQLGSQTTIQRAKDEVCDVRQQQERLRQQAADMKKADESAQQTLLAIEKDVTQESDHKKWQEQMSLLRKELAAETAVNSETRQNGREMCFERSHTLFQELVSLRGMTLRNQQLEWDEEHADDEEDDVTDTADCH